MSVKWKVALLFMAALMWWSGYHIGKTDADAWWQADEAKKMQTDNRQFPFGGSRTCYELEIGHGFTVIPCPKEQPKR